MTPEERILKLENEMQAMKNMATFPFEVENAIRNRLSVQGIDTSTKSATSENKSVNEGGASTYSVMDKPDGFVEVQVRGTIIYLPYFN
jgi:hypothetical protein